MDGMEITQFTYFQQVGGLSLTPVSGEITYGLERICMYLQDVETFSDLMWAEGVSYADVHLQAEVESSHYNFDEADVALLDVKQPERLAYVTQTTLSMDDTARVIDALRARFPKIEGPRKDDICYATQNRQDAVKQLAGDCDLMLVVGSPNSSNSNRLRELAERMGTPAYLIDEAAQIDPQWLEGKTSIGVTAGASAPEVLVNDVIARLQDLGGDVPEEIAGREENIVFSMPKELRIDAVNV